MWPVGVRKLQAPHPTRRNQSTYDSKLQHTFKTFKTKARLRIQQGHPILGLCGLCLAEGGAILRYMKFVLASNSRLADLQYSSHLFWKLFMLPMGAAVNIEDGRAIFTVDIGLLMVIILHLLSTSLSGIHVLQVRQKEFVLARVRCISALSEIPNPGACLTSGCQRFGRPPARRLLQVRALT